MLVRFDTVHDGDHDVGRNPKRVLLSSGAQILAGGQTLMPLLNLAVRRRCLMVGGPGRGKTAAFMGMR